MVSYTFDMDDKDKVKFEKVAENNHRSMAAHLRYLIDMYLSGKIEIKEEQ